MARAALLPYPGDPFLLNYWLKLYEQVWMDEVDTLYILHNSAIQKDVEEYIKDRAERAGAKYFYLPHQIEHGDAIGRLLEMSTEEYIMLIEDDAFIFRTGQVDKCFDYIESALCDVVAGKRGSCSDEISEAAKEKWGLDYSGRGDIGCNFWPCYFFANRSVFEGTDYNFGARAWEKGETIEPLEHVVQSEVVAGDTFVNMSLQLRAKGLKFSYEPQYHGSPYDLDDYTRRQNIFDGKAPWTHVGSLSSGIGGALKDTQGRSLSKKSIELPNKSALKKTKLTEQEKQEWERRVQWWLTFYQNREPGKIEDFAEEYMAAINRLIDNCGLSLSNIRRRQKVYATLGL